jgi:hypothetical protein
MAPLKNPTRCAKRHGIGPRHVPKALQTAHCQAQMLPGRHDGLVDLGPREVKMCNRHAGIVVEKGPSPRVIIDAWQLFPAVYPCPLPHIRGHDRTGFSIPKGYRWTCQHPALGDLDLTRMSVALDLCADSHMTI